MKTYEDYGCKLPECDMSKLKFTDFIIVVPTKKDKKDLQAAFEYIHNNRSIDTDFITVNQLAHMYTEYPEENANTPRIVVHRVLFEVCKRM